MTGMDNMTDNGQRTMSLLLTPLCDIALVRQLGVKRSKVPECFRWSRNYSLWKSIFLVILRHCYTLNSALKSFFFLKSLFFFVARFLSYLEYISMHAGLISGTHCGKSQSQCPLFIYFFFFYYFFFFGIFILQNFYICMLFKFKFAWGFIFKFFLNLKSAFKF